MTFRWRSALLPMLVCLLAPATGRAAGVLEGEWIGGFEGRGGPVFVRVLLGGTGETMAGRMDIPAAGEMAMLLKKLRGGAGRLQFELPAAAGTLQFDGSLKSDGRIRGIVRQDVTASTFELVRLAPVRRLGALEGVYETESGETLLLYTSTGGPAYVNYSTGRLGRLFATSPTTFIAGPSTQSGWPVELSVTVEPASGGATSLLLQRSGNAPVRAHRVERMRMERVVYPSDGLGIGATLVIPTGSGAHPAVVMIHGSGAVPREALIPAGVALALNGVAALLPDKRGVGESSGSWVRATFDELAADALAGVEFLRRRPEIDAGRIGLRGASQGGWVAPLAASRSSAVAFVIVEAAPTISPALHERLRVERQMTADGKSRSAIAKGLAFMDRKFEVGRTGLGWDRLVDAMREGERDGWLSYTNPPTSLESLQWNWKEVLSYDPAPALERLRVPVLAIYGELDTVVATGVNRGRLEELLARAGNHDVTVKVLPGANHNFFAARTGGPAELPYLRGYVPEYLSMGSDWLQDLLAAPHLPAVTDASTADAPETLASGPLRAEQLSPGVVMP